MQDNHRDFIISYACSAFNRFHIQEGNSAYTVEDALVLALEELDSGWGVYLDPTPEEDAELIHMIEEKLGLIPNPHMEFLRNMLQKNKEDFDQAVKYPSRNQSAVVSNTIAATDLAYGVLWLHMDKMNPDDIEFLARQENPLEMVRDAMISQPDSLISTMVQSRLSSLIESMYPPAMEHHGTSPEITI